MSVEKTYRRKTPATMARRVVCGPFYESTIMQFAFTDAPEEVVVEVDCTDKIGPVSGQQVVLISVLPHHPMSQTVAERIWDLVGWDEVEGNDWVDPAEVDVEAKGWTCRTKIKYSD